MYYELHVTTPTKMVDSISGWKYTPIVDEEGFIWTAKTKTEEQAESKIEKFCEQFPNWTRRKIELVVLDERK